MSVGFDTSPKVDPRSIYADEVRVFRVVNGSRHVVPTYGRRSGQHLYRDRRSDRSGQSQCKMS